MRYNKVGISVELLISLLGFLLLTSCLGKVEERSPFPDIKFDRKTYEFGEITQGAKVEYTYKFENAGNDTLKITKVRKGCGCQFAEATRKVIPPGEKGGIKVVFNSKGYAGKVTKTVWVHSNDPKDERVALTMTGTVIVDLIVRPRSLNFGDVPVGKSRSKKVHVISQNLKTLEIRNIDVSADYITVSTSDYTESGKKGVELEVTLGPNAPVSIIRENIKVLTNSRRQPLIEIPVYGRVVEKVSVEPKTLNFQAKPGESTKYNIWVYKGNRKNFKITELEDDLEDIETFLSFLGEEEDKQNYEIEIKVKPTASPDSPKGTIILHTNDPKQPTIRMQVFGVIE